MKKHLPHPASFNIAVGLEQFQDIPSEPKRLADAVRRLGDNLRGFKASHLRKTAARIEDLRTIAPENALAIEMLESAATTVHQAESLLVDLEARLAAAKAEEEERNWERFEPFGAQAVTKPLASEIGFTKAWIDKDNGWFRVRNGAPVAVDQRPRIRFGRTELPQLREEREPSLPEYASGETAGNQPFSGA